jgi:hypothetical protein
MPQRLKEIEAFELEILGELRLGGFCSKLCRIENRLNGGVLRLFMQGI